VARVVERYVTSPSSPFAAPASLISRIEGVAEGSGAVTFVGSAVGGDAERVSYRQLHAEARRMAAAMQQLGVGPGAHVALLGPTTRHLTTAVQATWICGAAAVMLPLPMRLASLDDFVAQTRARIGASDSMMLLVDDQLADFLDPEPGDPPVVRIGELLRRTAAVSEDAYVRPVDDPEALAILQYTSGSTSDPKGVMLPHRCVAANIDAIVRGARLVPGEDVGVSWLPLYHDMGLIGLLATPMCAGIDLVLASPQDFLAAPARWVEWMSAYGGSVTAGPNFSYVLAARSLRRLSSLDLSRWRLALNGAEPVDPEAVRAFVAAGAAHGLPATAAFPAFGMAEATLGVTFPEPGTGLRVDVVDRIALEHNSYAAPVSIASSSARELARLGRPLHNLQIRIVEPLSGTTMREREIGELEIRGDSVTPGYYHNPAATEAAFHDGWLRTGDLAYTIEGELVVCGRIKDVIILGGRNVHPQDVERAVNEVDGVRPGNVIAFGTPGRRGREAIVVVAETKETEHARLREAIKTAVYGSVGMPPEEVVLVAPGSLPKTSSGKLQRGLCRQRYLSESL
jgi:fatty-acyl-CoA synthase